MHVYGTLVAARRDAGKTDNDERPQHIGAVDEEREVGDETGDASILCLCFNELPQKGDDLDESRVVPQYLGRCRQHTCPDETHTST